MICRDGKLLVSYVYTHLLAIVECDNRAVRLIGGGFENEGTVEVCTIRQWSYIADANFTSSNAYVICRQLGYTQGLCKSLVHC